MAEGRFFVELVVVEEDEEEDKLEKGEEASRHAGDDKTFLSVPRLLCCVWLWIGNTMRGGQHIHSGRARVDSFCARACPTANVAINETQQPTYRHGGGEGRGQHAQ